MLSLVLPKGSLERATLDLFDAADLSVQRGSDRDYHASIDDPRIVAVFKLSQEGVEDKDGVARVADDGEVSGLKSSVVPRQIR